MVFSVREKVTIKGVTSWVDRGSTTVDVPKDKDEVSGTVVLDDLPEGAKASEPPNRIVTATLICGNCNDAGSTSVN